MKDKIAFVTTIYRPERGIKRCIESILNQTYDNLIFYIICNDKTKDIIMPYSEVDKRVKVWLVDSEREVNYFYDILDEIRKTSIGYYACIDGDDWYEPNFLEKSINFMKENQLDISACGYKEIGSNGEILKLVQTHDNITAETYQVEQWFLEGWPMFATIWGIVYKTSIMENFNENSRPGIKEHGGRGGDTMFNYAVLPYVKRLGILKDCLYNYQQTNNSNSYTIKEGRLKSSATILHFILEFFKKIQVKDYVSIYFMYTQYGAMVLENINLLMNSEMSVKEKYDGLVYLLSQKENQILYQLTIKTRRDQFQSLYLKSIYMGNIFDNQQLHELVVLLYPQIDLFLNLDKHRQMGYREVEQAKNLLVDAILKQMKES